MKALPKDGWRYGFLLIVLFAIAALATQATINYIAPLVPTTELAIVTILLCTLTLGLMSISGAFALWAIRFSTEVESLRRVGRVVNAMTDIRDGVLSVDRRGRITGMNPTAHQLLDVPPDARCSLGDVHSELTPSDVGLLLEGTQPEEVECTLQGADAPRTLRFRSQPSKGVTLILVSDVTKLADTRAQHRRAAYLQLIGHIAQAIANDFNNLLCGISGHASLIDHSATDTETVRRSADAITSCANRGIHLAGRLLELSSSTQGMQQAIAHPATYVDTAIDGLVAELSPSWNVVRNVDPNVPPAGLAGIQIEHIVHGLGLLAVDTYDTDSTLSIHLGPPQDAGLYHTETDCSGIIIIAPVLLTSIDISSLHLRDAGVGGLIESVAATMLLQAGGRLDCFSSQNGAPIFRVCLPFATPDETVLDDERLPLGLEAYIANWNVLISGDIQSASSLHHYLESCSVNVESADGIIGVLSRTEHGEDLSAIILRQACLGDEHRGLLRAITKLCPQAGLVVEMDKPEDHTSFSEDIVFVPASGSPTPLVRAMIEARSLARARQSAS